MPHVSLQVQQTMSILTPSVFHIERRWKLQNESEHDAFQSAQQLGAIVELQRNLQRGDALVAIEAFVVIGKLCSAAVSHHQIPDEAAD